MSWSELEFASPAMPISASRVKLAIASLWKRAQRLARRTPKRLRLCESLALGERRFVAVVEFEGARFLLGGTATSLVLLSRLTDSRERAEDETKFSSVHEGEETNNRRREHTC